MRFRTPNGMSRRHFMHHLAGASALTGSALAMGHTLTTHADELSRNRKSAILLWMGGGPSTIDIWDLKPPFGCNTSKRERFERASQSCAGVRHDS